MGARAESGDCSRMYNIPVMTSLTRLCRDCYNLYREVEVYRDQAQSLLASRTIAQCARQSNAAVVMMPLTACQLVHRGLLHAARLPQLRQVASGA